MACKCDNKDGILVDSQTEKSVHDLISHWTSPLHPRGIQVGTSSPPETRTRRGRVWDTRNLSKSVSVLRGNLGAIWSIRFTSDGQFMAMAEPADFVHIFDVKSGFERRQEVDFSGEISGMSFSPDTESLFIGIWDRTCGSLLQYSRCKGSYTT